VDVALISDAGTPLISDPGYWLVQRAVENSIKVVPVPGPSAAIAALSVSGLPSDRFCFEGFLPAKAGARQKALQSLAGEPRTLIFYEAPHRIVDSLQDMVAVFGATRPAVVARELTKTFETVLRGSLESLLAQVSADPNQQKGEFVVLVQGIYQSQQISHTEQDHLLAVLLEAVPVKTAAALASKISGVKKNQLYDRALQLKKNHPQ
jgi:16S rRNA (cytidine1402-2'-O)-methyltransferase